MTPKEAPVLEGGYKRKTLLWITGVAAASFVLFLVLFLLLTATGIWFRGSAMRLAFPWG